MAKAKPKGSSTRIILAPQFGVVSFYASQSKPGSVNLGNYMVNETSKSLAWLTLIKRKISE